MIRANIKPVEEQLVATLETQGKRLQSQAVHVATVDLPIWKDRMYEATAPIVRSSSSFLLIAVTVKAPRFIQTQTVAVESAWTEWQPIVVRSLESFKTRTISFAMEDGPRYLTQWGTDIQKAVMCVMDASWQEKVTAVPANEDPASKANNGETPNTNGSNVHAEVEEE